jgi:DNA-binding SARP family transcriptional activator/TolB-like protein
MTFRRLDWPRPTSDHPDWRGAGTDVEMQLQSQQGEGVALRLQLLGSLTLARGAETIDLPKSRKVRALLAYLALAPREITRSRLCELLWESPSDPRGELRWCLSRIRSVMDDPNRARVVARGDSISLDLSDCRVDALEIGAALQDLPSAALSRMRAIEALFGGELLEDLQLDDSPLFVQWLGSERRRLSTGHAQLLGAILKQVPEDSEAEFEYLGKWLAVEPFERSAHEKLLKALVRRGRLREAEEHLAATIRLFELEGLEWVSIREAWRAARSDQRGANVRISASVAPEATVQAAAVETKAARRASVCVMPFLEHTASGVARSRLGDGLADDIITRLAKLRVLFVIARGTAFSLGDRNVEGDEAARLLGVDYLANGTVRRRNGRIQVRVELAETRQPRVVWSDDLECSEAEALAGLNDLGNGIVASIAEEVESAERNRAVLKAPTSLDAWEAYHRGLWHMYRFNSADNDQAEHFFRISAQLDPTFARAHAGLSFAHFQNAFLHRPNERRAQIDRAFAAAGQSLMADDRDPAAHWAMGRALWLKGEGKEALSELGLSVDLSPNFALGHYTVGFIHCQSGDPQTAIDSAAYSRALSPFDPLLFAMLGTHALAHARLGNYEEAAMWALKAAARPNAHSHIMAIAAHCLALAGRIEEARGFIAKIHTTLPRYSFDDFLAGFRFTAEVQALLKRGAQRIGFA